MSQTMTPYEALNACLKEATSQSALARDLGVSQPTVWRWLQSAKRMPAEYVLTAERLYGVSRHLLRPDIYPSDLRPFAPAAETMTEPGSGQPCERKTDLQPGEEAEPRLPLAPTIERQEHRE